MSFIILTKEQADAVRGETTPGHALQPIEQEDGSFFLPARVLDAPEHASKRVLLVDLPRADFATAKVVEWQ